MTQLGVAHGRSHNGRGEDPIPDLVQAQADLATEIAARIANDITLSNALNALGSGIVQTVAAAASAVPSSTSETDIVSQSFTTSGGRVIALGWAKININVTAAPYAVKQSYFLKRGATYLQAPTPNWTESANSTGSIGVGVPQPFVVFDTPGAGTYTYTLRGLYTTQAGTVNGTPTAEGYLLLIELSL